METRADDRAEAEAFLFQLIADAGRTTTVLLAALGDRLGLFKALDEGGPAASAELAQRAAIHERYAREWLEAMASAGYLRYDPPSGRYRLPAEHAPALAHEGGPLFFGGTLQGLLGSVGTLPLLARAFREGGGVPMAAYGEDTWDGMERDMAGVYASRLVQHWVPALPEVQALLERGARVADVGCGRGRVLILLAQAFPGSTYVGYDVYPPNVARARENAAAAGVGERARFESLDAAAALPESFDLIWTFDVVHDVADPLGLLRSIRAALRPGGRYVSLDIKCAERPEHRTHPMDTLRYGFSLLYCLTTALGNGGEGLGTLGLTESRMRALCAEAGFREVRVAPLDDRFHTLYEVIP